MCTRGVILIDLRSQGVREGVEVIKENKKNYKNRAI